MGKILKYFLINIWIHNSFQIELCLPDEVFSLDNLKTKIDLSTVECNRCSDNCLSCDRKSCRSCWSNSLSSFKNSICLDKCSAG